MNITHSGFLIHVRKYKETSSIVHIFSRDKGIQSLIFKGNYSNKDKFKFSLFNEYLFSYNDKYSFPYLSKFEIIKNFQFDKKYYLLGLYINELLYKTIREGYEFEKVYEYYKGFLVNLANPILSVKSYALLFEKNLIHSLGYGLSFSDGVQVQENTLYSYDFNDGFKVIDSSQNKYFITGLALKKFFSNTLEDSNDIEIIRLIIKKIFKHHYPDMELLGDKLL